MVVGLREIDLANSQSGQCQSRGPLPLLFALAGIILPALWISSRRYNGISISATKKKEVLRSII